MENLDFCFDGMRRTNRLNYIICASSSTVCRNEDDEIGQLTNDVFSDGT